jgi:hypothetical protein
MPPRREWQASEGNGRFTPGSSRGGEAATGEPKSGSARDASGPRSCPAARGGDAQGPAAHRVPFSAASSAAASLGYEMRGARPRSRYYLCQPHQRSTAIPAGYPTTIDVGEKPLIEAVNGYLATAVFGPDRRRLARSPPVRRKARGHRSHPSPGGRAGEGDRRRRGPHPAPDVVLRGTPTPALRRRVAERIAELDAFVAEKKPGARATP